MAITSRDEAWLFCGPRPSMASEKILDHITDKNSPTPNTLHLAVSPEVHMLVRSKPMITALNKTNIRCALAAPMKNATSRTASIAPYLTTLSQLQTELMLAMAEASKYLLNTGKPPRLVA